MPRSVAIGAIRTWRKQRFRYRFLKTDNGWVRLCRWLWQQHYGPIPHGMRVGHINGNTLDDRIENYELRSPGDTFLMAEERAPKRFRRNESLRIQQIRRSVQERAKLRRRFEVMRWQWYPVIDSTAQVVLAPCDRAKPLARLFRGASHVSIRLGCQILKSDTVHAHVFPEKAAYDLLQWCRRRKQPAPELEMQALTRLAELIESGTLIA